MTERERSPAERLAEPSLTPLVDELVRRFERGDVPVRITLPDLDEQGRRALADLLGTDRYPSPGSRLAVDRLAAALGTVDRDGLRGTVETLRGPLVDRRRGRQAAAAARDGLWEDLERDAGKIDLFGAGATAGEWTDRVRKTGIPDGDVEAHRERLRQTIAVLHRLPTTGITLTGLAADVIGDAHGLDPGRRVTRLVIDALAACDGADPPTEASAVRAIWEGVGVAVDPLSSTVLTLGLRGVGAGPAAEFLARSADASEPVVLTYAQLIRWPIRAPARRTDTFLFENPAMLAEAARTGWSGPPLLCSSGRPTVAVVTLIHQLRSSGVTVHQHADLDPAGLGITAWLAQRAGTVPWHMTAEAYRDAVRTTGATLPIVGDVPETPWDPELAQLMITTSVAVHEEAIRHDLLDDLGALHRRSTATEEHSR